MIHIFLRTSEYLLSDLFIIFDLDVNFLIPLNYAYIVDDLGHVVTQLDFFFDKRLLIGMIYFARNINYSSTLYLKNEHLVKQKIKS